jgi:hypothetical protein
MDTRSSPGIPIPGYGPRAALLLTAAGVLVLLGTAGMHLSIKAPGHSGLVWMALLVTARLLVPCTAAATAVGALSGLIGVLVGVGDKGALVTFCSYLAPGLAVDVVAAGAPPGLLRCAFAGLAANVCKLAVKAVLESWIGARTGFLAVGLGHSLLGHALFGIGGGLLGYAMPRALARTRVAAWVAAPPR